MVDIKEYLRKSGGNWLRAGNVQVGDKLQLLDDGFIDDQTFDRSYLVFNILLQRTGEQFKLRLGSQNVTRIAETLGNDSSKWKNGHLEVISIENYPGLGRGILLRGLSAQPQQMEFTKPIQQREVSLSTEALQVINESKDLIDLGIPMNLEDFNSITASVRAELIKLNLVTQKEELYFFTDSVKKLLES